MKKIYLMLIVSFLSIASFSQRKKAPAQKGNETSALPKLDNFQVEVRNSNFQVAIIEKGKPKDAIVVKTVDATFTPINCKLTSFSVNGVKLYLLSWTETSITKTELKTENMSMVYSVIYEMTAKKQVFSNYQLTNNITEKVFLDKNKTASETQEKIRREGFEFILNPDGSIIQKNKTQQNILVYDKDKMEFKKK